MKNYSILVSLLCVVTLLHTATPVLAAPKTKPAPQKNAQQKQTQQNPAPKNESVSKDNRVCTIRITAKDSTLFKPGVSIVLGNADKRIPIDTGVIVNGLVEFHQPYTQDLLYIQVNGKKVLDFFTDASEVSFRLGRPIELLISGELNHKWQKYNQEINTVLGEYYKKETPEDRKQALEQIYNTITNDALEANKTNNIGIALLGGLAYDLNMRQLDSMMALVPGSQNSQFISRIYQSKKIEYKTRPGVKFTDFKARNADNTKDVALSEIVGKGKYVLADFWATWCGPCRHEFPYIRKAHELYKDKGLVVLGVNVWDKFPAFTEGLTKYDMIWNHIYASDNRSATDTYGIAGIPHIILFGPDGTIIARGLRGEQMLKKLAVIFK